MHATLAESSVQTMPDPPGEAELSALVDTLLREVGQLRREVAELRQEAGYWKGMFTQAKRKNEKLQQEIDELRAENRQLKDKLYGTKSEKTHCWGDTPQTPRFQRPIPRVLFDLWVLFNTRVLFYLRVLL